jgi:hypothetical protein
LGDRQAEIGDAPIRVMTIAIAAAKIGRVMKKREKRMIVSSAL